MEAYETLGILGEGTYGVVMKARHRATGKLVAIKRFKQTDEDEHVRKTSTREVRMLQQLKHPNVVRLEDVFRREGKLYLVFEFIDKTILQVLETTTRGIQPRELRRFIYQLLRGVEFCHAHNVIHRDVKPENVLIDQSGMLKLCDFGFARQMTSKGKYTDYVATRWYRAPELLVGDVAYGKPVDVWALGCMFAELSDGQPLFPGESDLDQLCLIIQTCGPVPDRMVSIFEHNPLYRNVSYPHTGIVYTLQERYHRQPEDWLEFLYACLHPDPAKRLTCTELMALPYFTRDGFRERYEQELRAISGLPMLRANPTASAPAHSPTRRAAAEKTAGPKNAHEATVPAPTASNAPVIETQAPGKKMAAAATAAVAQKGEVLGKYNSVEVAKSKESDAGFLPAVQQPASVPTETPVQLPMILSQSAEKAGATGGAALMATNAAPAPAAAATGMDEAAPGTSTHRRHVPPSISPDTVASPMAASGNLGAVSPHKSKSHRSDVVSQPCSAVLSSKRTSLTSSLAVSPVKKTDHIVIGSTYPDSHRRLSSMTEKMEGGDGYGNPAAEAAAGAAASRRTSRSLYSNASPRSSSLKSDLAAGDRSTSIAAAASSSVSTQSTLTTTTAAALAAAPADGSQRLATEHPYLTPLAERLPDLASPRVHLAAHHKRGSVDAEDIPKPPLQAAYSNSPTSFNGSTVSHPSLYPLAAPPSRERNAAKNAIVKARRSGPHDASEVPHSYTKKKLAKRRKEGVVRRGSRQSSSRSTSRCSPQDQLLDALRMRAVNGQAPHDAVKHGSASVSAFKMSISRTSSHPRDCLTSQDLREEEALDRALDEERANRLRGTVSGSHNPGTTAAVKRQADTRTSMPRKERRSKPLHANSPAPQPLESTSRPPPQPTQTQGQQLDTFLHPEGNDVAQRASAALMALSALRDNTGALHPAPHDGGYAEKSSNGRAHAISTEYGVPTPPQTQSKDGPSQPTSKATRSRKPLGVYSLQSTRRSLDESEGGGHGTALHVHDTSALTSLPSSQYGGFAVPYRRTSRTESNGGGARASAVSLSSTNAPTATQPQPPPRKARKKRNSISGDCGGGGAMPYTLPHTKELPTPPTVQSSTAAINTEKPAPRRQESGGTAGKKFPQLMYSTATAAATQM